MMHRTNIYLEEVQQEVLRQLAASRSETMSDVIRRAIDRYISEEMKSQDLGKRMDALAERVRSRYAAPTDEQIDVLVERGRNPSHQQQRPPV
jgi:predicted DNA-binding protein